VLRCVCKDGVMVMSGTHRYRKKYVTTLLYKPTNWGTCCNACRYFM